MSRRDSAPLVVNRWTLFAHPLFLSQLEALTEQVEALRAKDPASYKRKSATRRLAAIRKLALEVIPTDPARPEYRQGKTLGKAYKHWFRAKFFQQYRLFFRFHTSSKIIVYAWVNDDNTLRAYESANDAYRVFRKMLDGGNPPDDWDSLLNAARSMRGDHRGL
ncbi:MAG: type II toxin-antitoxin system YhaV family toxin [Gammaproteobacteria bacterium]|jgi:toxin YhaV|nr:type II toxin-antitoxin system YhaV family toxin [Gammaproteobacteria bacterium]